MGKRFLFFLVLVQNPTAFVLSLVLVPLLLVLFFLAALKILLAAAAITAVLLLIDAHRKAKRRRALGRGMVPLPQRLKAPEPLSLEGVRKW